MTHSSTDGPRAATLVRWLRLVALATGLVALHPDHGATASPGTATGRADVRLIRLLSEVPESFRQGHGHLHDLRVQLVRGNVLVFKKGGEFSALLPVDQVAGTPDSLRYFFYVEKPPMLWFFGGGRTKGIRTVADGGLMRFNSFQLLWEHGSEGAGWIYFPDTEENKHLRFSVVSGQTVDRADPEDTKYWVELGAEEKAGF